MSSRKFLALLCATALMACMVVGVSAQATSGTVTLGQPQVGHISTAGQTNDYSYTAKQPTQITLQALGDTVKPTITILSNGNPVAQEANASGALTINLSALLDAGSYTVRVGAVDNTTGIAILVLQSETAVTTTPLTPNTPVAGVVNATAPLAIYSFSAMTDPAYLYVKSGQQTSGVSLSLTDTAAGKSVGQMDASVLGERLEIPAGSTAYQVEIRQSAATSTDAFTICLSDVNSPGCEAGAPAQPPITAQAVVQPTQASQATTASGDCLVTPAQPGAVNIRQSASAVAMIVDALPNGASANAIGISPDKLFYNVLYNGSNGWVSVPVVTTSGDCTALLTITPPPVILAPTTAPAQPTAMPAQPTQPLPPTASGPCIITMTKPTFVYTTTKAIEDDLFDQVQPGVQITPVGKLADNSWWKLTYFGTSAWIETKQFGNGANASGDCSGLPVVPAP